MTRPNGVNTNYSYDSLSRLLSVLHQTGATTIDGATYTYDNAGNRLTKLNHLNAVTETYSYDNIYQLLTVLQGATTTESYAYDKVGNRLSDVSGASYNYNNSNQLSSISGTPGSTFTYDNDGNTVTKVDGTGTTTYTWNSANQLTQVNLPGGATVTFKYDPFGRRVQKVAPSGTINYLYDGANVIHELDSAGLVVAKYVQGQRVDQPLAVWRGSGASFYQADGLGTVTALTNTGGVLTASYTYDAFGQLTASTGTLINPLHYTGREFDTETGMYYYRARYYQPKNGRFASEDAFAFQAGINFYLYVSGNPINFIDPSGYKPCLIDVRCWPIEKWNLGALGLKHCYVFVRNEKCELRDISGGPENGRLRMWETGAQAHPEAETYAHALIPCKLVDCMILEVPRFNGQDLAYDFRFQNSNSGLATILSACGLADLIQYMPDGASGSDPLPKGGLFGGVTSGGK